MFAIINNLLPSRQGGMFTSPILTQPKFGVNSTLSLCYNPTMGILERFKRKPSAETRGLIELAGKVADKLLNDLRSGYIAERYNGDVQEEETLLQDIRHSVVLKRGGKYFLVNLSRGCGDRDTDFHRALNVHEYRSLEEMNQPNNDLPFVVFKEGQMVWGYSGYFWSFADGSHGWSRLDLNIDQTKSFLFKVLNATVDIRVTQERFDYEIARDAKYGWANSVIKWPGPKEDIANQPIPRR